MQIKIRYPRSDIEVYEWDKQIWERDSTKVIITDNKDNDYIEIVAINDNLQQIEHFIHAIANIQKSKLHIEFDAEKIDDLKYVLKKIRV